MSEDEAVRSVIRAFGEVQVIDEPGAPATDARHLVLVRGPWRELVDGAVARHPSAGRRRADVANVPA